MRRRMALPWLLVAAACCSKTDVKSNGSGGSAKPDAPPNPTFTLFALAEVRGQIGPCGCTSDPLGDLSRTAKLVTEARGQGPTLVVDAGSLLYSKNPIPPQYEAQEELKADLLATTYTTELKVSALGLGPADLARGPSKTRLPRSIANVTAGDIKVVAPTVISDQALTGGTKVGVFGVALPEMINGVMATPPIEAGKAAVAELKKQGAQVIVGLIQAPSKKDAVKLMRDIGGIDLVVAGLGALTPEPERIEIEAQKVGEGWIVVPANRGQIVSKLEITMRGAGPLVDAVGPAVATIKLASLDRRIESLDEDLKKFAADPKADPAFVKTSQDERAGLIAQRTELGKTPLVIPAAGNYFTLSQVKINKALACEKSVDDRVTEYFRAAGLANVKAAKTLPPEPGKNQPRYEGGAACEDCHAEAVRFWETTRHAQAWKTLVDRGQQFDFDCTSCHVTGWERPGGSNLAFNEPLRNVQCEVCHGPSSTHVARGGDERPLATQRLPAEALCASQCHTPEHSDTFEHTAYMRDILGPGHGEAARKKLGDGPTGAQLRKAALDKAGRSLGAGCSR